MKKRALSLLLALVMCLGLLPAMAFAAGDISGSCGSNLTYRFDSATGTLTISGSGEMEKNTYYGLRGMSPAGPVYGNYYRWPWESDADFDGKDVITSVVIEEGVTSVGERAFERYKSLTHVTIPSSVTTIGSNAFHECSALTSVDIKGSGLTSIGDYAFYDCSSLTGLDIPASVTSIGYGAFRWCFSLTTVTFRGSGLTSIGNRAFDKCTSLTDFDIPSSVTSIGDSAFLYCSSLTSVTIPNGITHLDSGSFSGCDSLRSVTIPTSVTSIKGSSFPSPLDIYYQGTVAQWKAIDGSDAFEKRGFTIHFSDVPDVAVSASPAALTFQMEEDGVSYPLWVTVKNEGVVDITLVQPTATYFDISMERTSVSAGSSVQFSVQPKSGLPAGTYSETITVKTSDGQGTASVDAALTVTEKPAPLPFNDVPEFLYRPVAWALEKGITSGTSATTFSPNDTCTRAHVVTFLWNAAGRPEPENSASQFTDMQNPGEYYYKAVLWAVENGITSGTSTTTFSPDITCTRGQIVTFLYLAFK